MIKTDANQFKDMINVLYEMKRQSAPSNELLRLWWIKLVKHDIEVVAKAFDTWVDNSSDLPTPHDIMLLCRPKVTIQARIASPLAKEANEEHVKEVVQYIADNIKPQTDYRAWARKIIANPKNYPEISLKYAKEALISEMAN